MWWRSLAAAVLATLSLAAAPSFNTAKLWERDTGEFAIYRIPGIVVTASGTVLAYCEARVSDRGDWVHAVFMLRRSTDGGRTFSPPRVVVNLPGAFPKNPVAIAKKMGIGEGVTYNNPVLIADRRRGLVHFLFCVEYMRAFYMRSTDDGVTWSTPVEITSAFDQFRPEYDWKVLATGPGHGIQLRNGRLLVPVWLSPGTGGGAHRPSVTSVIYSDDGGSTWKRGDIAAPDTPEWIFPNETAAVQVPDGRVMLNIRSESKAHRRLVTFSRDGAIGWTSPAFNQQLLEPVCFGSTVRYDRKRILFVNPDSLSGRLNLTVQLSADGGATWKIKRTVDAGPSGYADIAVLPDGRILCLYEGLERTARGGWRSLSLILAKFNLEWLKGSAAK